MNGCRRILMLAVFALLAGACGGQQPTSRGTPGADATGGADQAAGSGEACMLLEPEDVAEAFGSGRFTEEPNPNDPSLCVWATGGQDAIQVVVSLRGPAYAEGNRTAFEGHTRREGAQEVTGVGERAVWVPSDATLYVLASDTIIPVTALDSAYQDLEFLKKVAATAVANL